MAEGNGKSGNPAKKKELTPSTYVLYKLGEDRNLEFVTTSEGIGRNDAIENAVKADSALAGVPLVPIAQSRLVQLAGAAQTSVKVKPV